MDEQQRRVIRQTLAVTAACIIGSVAITAVITYLASGTLNMGIGILIAVLAPGILVPIGGYRHILMADRLKQANERLRTLSETDPLTGTYNRRRFLEVAEKQLALCRRHGFPASILLIDFDRFKAINDRHGHPAGDHVLCESTALIRRTLRDSDTLARFGGEEFIVLLPHTAREGALMVAERIITAIRGHVFELDGGSIQVTVSIGGATCETSETPLEQMTSKADNLLYAAKGAGRDRYMVEGLPRQAPLPFKEATP